MINRRGMIGSVALLGSLAAVGFSLAAWKKRSLQEAEAAAAAQPEPIESVTVSISRSREHRPTTTSVGTVLALRSITLRNELAGTVREVKLPSGSIVEEGEVLVMLDTSVEEAELNALEAKSRFAEAALERVERLSRTKAATEQGVDQARAEHDVAVAQIARTEALIAKKNIRAPFRARVGLADVHPGQYLEEGTQLTTLQGVDDSVHVDFTVAQRVAAQLQVGDCVDVLTVAEASPISARVIALDSRIDSTTRNAMVRAVIEGSDRLPSPGASVQVHVPTGPPRDVVAIPATALRKGAGGDHVYVVAPDKEEKLRAQLRRVESGPMVGEEILIYSGLAVGEQVAASGSFKLREGTLVAISSDADAPQEGEVSQAP